MSTLTQAHKSTRLILSFATAPVTCKLSNMISTPTRDEYDDDEELDDGQFGIMPATPAPLKARVNNLTNQVSELVRANQHHEKRHKAEVSRYKTQLDEAKSERDQAISEAKTKSKELERCRAEGDGKMHEASALILPNPLPLS